MKARNVAVVGVAAAAGAAPSEPTTCATHPRTCGGTRCPASACTTQSRISCSTAATTRSRGRSPRRRRLERRWSTSAAGPARCSCDSRAWRPRWSSRASTSIRRWSRGQGPRRSARSRRAAGARPSSSPTPARSPSPTRRSTSWSARTPSITSPTATPPGPRSSACSSLAHGRSSGTSPAARGRRAEAHGAPSAGHRAPASRDRAVPHAAGALDIVRMLLKFGRIPAERYELVQARIVRLHARHERASKRRAGRRPLPAARAMGCSEGQAAAPDATATGCPTRSALMPRATQPSGNVDQRDEHDELRATASGRSRPSRPSRRGPRAGRRSRAAPPRRATGSASATSRGRTATSPGSGP